MSKEILTYYHTHISNNILFQFVQESIYMNNLYLQNHSLKKLCIIVSTVIGIPLGILMSGIAFVNNSQGEIYDQLIGTIDYSYLFLIFLSWFVIGFFISLLLLMLIKLVASLLKK